MADPVGLVFDVSRACFDDGPGLRTVVFLLGCRLGCPWCHNPEGRSLAPRVVVDPSRCVDCGACRRGDGGALRCPTGARRLVGERLTVEELIERVAVDADFFAGTGGGVTFSGGEPMCQPDFLLAAAESARARGMHVAVETAGFWGEELAPALAEAADLVIFDVKHVDLEALRAATGREGRAILANLAALIGADVELAARYTPVPGFNDSTAARSRIEAWLSRRGYGGRLEVVPYHRMGARKARLLRGASGRSGDVRGF